MACHVVNAVSCRPFGAGLRRSFAKRLLGAVVLAQVAAHGVIAGEPKPEELAWIKDHAIAFVTPEAGHGFDDLMPLKDVVGDARIVALGEATHGTREFFQMKHRLVEFLASEMGFTVFSIEANMPEAYRLNDFVLTGVGDPEALIGGMYFWTWNTHEVLDMVLWMRDFNKSGKGRIEFTGFDMQTPDVAMQIVQRFVEKADPAYAAKVDETYAAAQPAKRVTAEPEFGLLVAEFPAAAVAGKQVRYSGHIKTENVTQGYAGLWWRVDDASGTLRIDNMEDRGAKGTADWQRFEIVMDVDPGATTIGFGALMPGEGVAWFDSLHVEIDGAPYSSEPRFDFDFESGTAKGFYTGGEVHEVEVVSDQANSGTRSLRMKHVGTKDRGGEQPAAAALACGEVLDHLEASRGGYLQRLPKKGVEWAIQNARVVQQCYLDRAGAVPRDESMAKNVRWILDHAPKDAKIALWAHNGHVRKDLGSYGHRPMGSHLCRWYGSDMVVFGFTCHTGHYTAVKQGAGLQTNALHPAEAGSAAYRFHKTGLPRFILDLDDVSVDVPASVWLIGAIDARSIGALAMEKQFQPTTLPSAYDAMIYFDKTTASRLLGR